VKVPRIISQEPLAVKAGVSRLAKVRFARNPAPALLKEPAQFWDEPFIANEALMLDAITHPRVRQKLAYVAETHQLFLEYLEAETLQDLVIAGVTRQDPGRTHHLLLGVAETLADLHAGIFCRHPVIYNDLKSANVLVPVAAPRSTVLIDFSHSYFEGRLPPCIADNKREPTGTAKYLAPEKWGDNDAYGFKGDVFAFGVLSYYAYTGRHPFDGDINQIEQQIREVAPPSPLELGVNVPRNVLAITLSCLEKKPEHRPTMENIARYYADSASLFP
jgi:serine/threonine protein kinase